MSTAARGSLWDLPVLRGGWTAIPKLVVDRRFATISITSRVRHVGGPQCGLVVVFGNHVTDPLVHPTFGGSAVRHAATNAFVLCASNDDDRPSCVMECQRALAAVAVFYSGTAVRLSVETERCGVLSWSLERDGCFGSSSIATCASVVVSAVKAVAILNANVTLPQSNAKAGEYCGDAKGDVGYLLLLLYHDGERRAAAGLQEVSDCHRARQQQAHCLQRMAGVVTSVVHALRSLCTPCGKRLLAPSAMSPCDATPPTTDAHDGSAPIVLPLDAVSAHSQPSASPVRNVVLMLNVEPRASAHVDAATLAQACTTCVQDALLRLTADHVDLFGRARRQRQQGADAAGTGLQDATRIQSIADAIASMVVTSRARTAPSGLRASPFEMRLCALLGLPVPSRNGCGPSETTTTPAAIRFAIEEQLHRQYVG